MFKRIYAVVATSALLVIALGVSAMPNLKTIVPLYWVKIISPSGSVIAAPLTADGTPDDVSFTDVSYVPGQHQLGSFSIALRNIRDPRWKFMQTVYNTLNYRQRVEIYPNRDLLGDPVFTGVITRLPGDLNKQEIAGVSSLQYLEDRKLRRYHNYNSGATAIAQDLCQTYQVVLKDNFDNLSNWTATVGSPSASANMVIFNPGVGTPASGQIETNTTFTSAQWKNSKIALDFFLNGIGTVNNSFSVAWMWANAGNDFASLTIYNALVSDSTTIQFNLNETTGGVSQIYTRFLTMSTGTLNHIDIYSILANSTRKIIVVLNGVELFNINAAGTHDYSGTARISGVGNTGNLVKAQKFVFFQKLPCLTPGLVDTDATNINQTFNGISQLAALEWLCINRNWSYRLRPRAGFGNDIIDIGANIGTDMSSVISFEETNFPQSSAPGAIVNLSADRTSDEIATSLLVYGQSQDDGLMNFIDNNLAAFDTFGIIENEYSDPQIVDAGMAKIIGDNRLAVVSAGKVSVSGSLIDETLLAGSFDPATWGQARWGNFVWGSVKTLLHPGDSVWLKSDTLNINRKVDIVSLTRKSGTPQIDVVFDYHAWTRSDLQRQFMQAMKMAYLQFQTKLNTIGPYTVTGIDGTPNVHSTPTFYLRGQMASVQIDLFNMTNAGAMYIQIDGTDRTFALNNGVSINSGGLTGNVSLKDTQWLTQSGTHYLSFSDNAGGATNAVTVMITAKMLG